MFEDIKERDRHMVFFPVPSHISQAEVTKDGVNWHVICTKAGSAWSLAKDLNDAFKLQLGNDSPVQASRDLSDYYALDVVYNSNNRNIEDDIKKILKILEAQKIGNANSYPGKHNMIIESLKGFKLQEKACCPNTEYTMTEKGRRMMQNDKAQRRMQR